MFVFSLLGSQSRSAIVSLFVCIFLVLTFHSHKELAGRLFYSCLMFVFLSISGFYIYANYGYELQYLVQGLSQMASGESSSLDSRLSQMDLVINNGLIFGSGVAKDFYKLESVPSVYILRYGFLGLMFFYFLLWLVANMAKKISYNNSEYRNLFKTIHVWFLSYPIISLSSPHHDTPKLAIFFYGLVGLVFGTYEYYKDKKYT